MTADLDPAAAVKAASDYFNALPYEERKKLAPLLEEYRRMGMREYAAAVAGATRKMKGRMNA